MAAFDEVVERIARAFHTEYERIAPSFGWQTQESARDKSFDELPESNRALVLATVRRLLERGVIDPGEAVVPKATTVQTPTMRTLAVPPGLFVSVPTTVQAMHYEVATRGNVTAWLDSAGAVWWPSPHRSDRIMLLTPQGSKPVDPGNWVVRGVVGEWYPVAADVFQMRYRVADDDVMTRR